MLTWIKRLGVGIILLVIAVTAGIYGVLSLSLPQLDGKGVSDAISTKVIIERDTLGQAIIHADSRLEASYALGYAHGQDRFFQMDLLRRNAAGELSELFGEKALKLDKQHRFHQFRQRSEAIYQSLPKEMQAHLRVYAQGVNEGKAQAGYDSFEYLLTGTEPAPWLPEESLLVIYSMYLDLQAITYHRDEALIIVAEKFGTEFTQLILQPSEYQSALDGSRLPMTAMAIPALPMSKANQKAVAEVRIGDDYEVGSNNWAVTGDLTRTGSAMLSDDMHLGLSVPALWYRAQLNYKDEQLARVVTGVSLPGTPGIVVGSNNHIAWGFTNGYLDTADWVKLPKGEELIEVVEQFKLKEGGFYEWPLLLSQFGPVKEINGQFYALNWVAHQPFSANLNILQFESATTVEQALPLATDAGMPVQNLMVVDERGRAAWKLMGAIPQRAAPSDLAKSPSEVADTWHLNLEQRPHKKVVSNGRLWTANSRVVSSSQHEIFGDGGYALGARAVQIEKRLMAGKEFDESQFNDIQLDNRADFLLPWHAHLMTLLASHGEKYTLALKYLKDWQACACPDSVGYSLVKAYREALIDVVYAPLEVELQQHGSSLRPLKRYLEPSLWQMIKSEPDSWLGEHADWHALKIYAFEVAISRLEEKFGNNMAGWNWGAVNALTVQHPFSRQLPWLSQLLDMPVMPGFGDTFMPAVQGSNFGASQRFIAQPGHLENAVMTVSGGQSAHPLSPFYRTGFKAYAQGELTPLLPGPAQHSIEILSAELTK